jgi:hypothetical protein
LFLAGKEHLCLILRLHELRLIIVDSGLGHGFFPDGFRKLTSVVQGGQKGGHCWRDVKKTHRVFQEAVSYFMKKAFEVQLRIIQGVAIKGSDFPLL